MVDYRILLSRQFLLWLLIIVIALTITLNSCNSNTTPPTVAEQIANGEVLSKKYCTSCHEWNSPALIDRKSWVSGVLPAMAKNLGINTFMGQYYQDKASVVGMSDWQDIVTYYTHTAPDFLIIPNPRVAPLNDWAIFSLVKPKNVSKVMPAMTTMLSFDTTNRKLYSGDASGNLFEWDNKLNEKQVYHFDSAVTGLIDIKNSGSSNTAIVTCIGTLQPLNLYKGKVYSFNLSPKNKNSQPSLITDSLPRPVATVAADFNKDGLMDYVTCAFGHDNGALYLLQQQANHSFKKVILSSIAGGEQLITGDFNNDGWPDVMCLFAQADEGVRMFLNDHKGGFTMQTLLRFPPVYGSSSFQLVDLNHDGKPDILYTCGDNSDYSKVLKPYHGVYIFTNLGNWKFKQTYFYHIDGCTKAMAADFDHTGHMDIAAIAFFSDFKYHPQEGFTYLQQQSPNQYIAHEIPVDNQGRWLEMQVADVDHDGYDDIVLGNFSINGRGLLNQKNFVPAWDMHQPFILLKNNAGKSANQH